jgi:hypothetical protein
MSWQSVTSKIILFLILMGGYVELHEVAHSDICEYAGGHSFRKDFLTVGCIEAEDNHFAREAYILDNINELIASLFFPIFSFIYVKWIIGTE